MRLGEAENFGFKLIGWSTRMAEEKLCSVSEEKVVGGITTEKEAKQKVPCSCLLGSIIHGFSYYTVINYSKALR